VSWFFSFNWLKKITITVQKATRGPLTKNQTKILIPVNPTHARGTLKLNRKKKQEITDINYFRKEEETSIDATNMHTK